MAKTKKASAKAEITVEDTLKALYQLQLIDSETDSIKTLRGELPLEVQDLEDEIVGLETRIAHIEGEVNGFEESIVKKKNEIVEAQTLIKKYEDQQKNVRNNREYDSISKELEYQSLEIELCEKRIREFTGEQSGKKVLLEDAQAVIEERIKDLDAKKSELDAIIEGTEKEEKELIRKSVGVQKIIDARLLTAYHRIRENARNGLAVVTIERDACGGCFNKIPPQKQLDIKTRKKITVCEYCGRVLVDNEIDSDGE
ncbi:MAG: hypothetical protein J7L04_13210 [Bacteroidales bacterium]|nr:hypothetical protein [Bacteroidales bacterium]